MQLCLVHNDPTATLLMTPDGEALYSIETPKDHSASLPTSPAPLCAPPRGAPPRTAPVSPAPLAPNYHKSPTTTTTTVKRLEKWHASRGHVETEVGAVEFHGHAEATRVRLCDSEEVVGGWEALVNPLPPQSGVNLALEGREVEEQEQEQEVDNSWEFTGPDRQQYKWMFLPSPILVLNSSPSSSSSSSASSRSSSSQSSSSPTPFSSQISSSQSPSPYPSQPFSTQTSTPTPLPNPAALTPLARYRRAKLGIVSRPRRASLEILPAGLGALDLIVLSFVGFMRARVVGVQEDVHRGLGAGEGDGQGQGQGMAQGCGGVEEGFRAGLVRAQEGEEPQALHFPPPFHAPSLSRGGSPHTYGHAHAHGGKAPGSHGALGATALAHGYWANGYASTLAHGRATVSAPPQGGHSSHGGGGAASGVR